MTTFFQTQSTSFSVSLLLTTRSGKYPLFPVLPSVVDTNITHGWDRLPLLRTHLLCEPRRCHILLLLTLRCPPSQSQDMVSESDPGCSQPDSRQSRLPLSLQLVSHSQSELYLLHSLLCLQWRPVSLPPSAVLPIALTQPGNYCTLKHSNPGVLLLDLLHLSLYNCIILLL